MTKEELEQQIEKMKCCGNCVYEDYKNFSKWQMIEWD